MHRILAIVEGHTEEHFIYSTHSNSRVIRPFPNGKNVSIDVIANSIAKQLRAFGNNYDEIIILLDLERRNVGFREFKDSLHHRLTELCPGRDFTIGVSDIQIENWILADETTLKSKYSIDYRYAGDGTAAKNALRDITGVNMSFRDKASLLKACNAERIAAASPSFHDFRQSVRSEWFWISTQADAA